MWAAFHAATDRYLMIDTVYLGSAKISALPETPWFSQFWAPTDDQLTTWPGYRPDRGEDLKLVNELIDATGFRDSGRTLYIILPDVWELRYPGITETIKGMYESAMGIEVSIDIQPYTVILQRLVEGTYPGDGPSWTNPPSDLDPTSSWINGRVPGGSSNLYNYEHPRVTELAAEMKINLDLEEKKVMADEVVEIMMGVHPDTGWDGHFALGWGDEPDRPQCKRGRGSTRTRTPTSSRTPGTTTSAPGWTRTTPTTRRDRRVVAELERSERRSAPLESSEAPAPQRAIA